MKKVAIAWMIVLVIIFGSTIHAQTAVERPTVMRLLPQETVLLLRTPSAREMFSRLDDTATGRMLRDPQVESFVARMYGLAEELFTEEAAEEVGISFEELQRLPQGEVAFAIVARQEARPAFFFLADLGEENQLGQQLIDRGLETIAEDGGSIAEETMAEVTVRVIRDGDNQDRSIGVAQIEDTFFLATDPNLMTLALERFQGIEPAESDDVASANDEEEDEPDDQAEPDFTGTLAEDPEFANMLRTLRRPEDERPHFVWYVDPIQLVRGFGRDNTGLLVALATFPALGLDGFQGVGGSITFATDKYDDLSHIHVLLDNPRAGVLRLINFEDADTTPQDWIPTEIETYMSWSFDFQVTYERLVALVDKFQYEGAMQKLVDERVSSTLGFDLRGELLDNLAGRVSWFAAYETPPRMQSQRHVIGFQVTDPEQAEATLAKLVAKYPDLFEERQFGEATYQAMVIRAFDEMPEDERPVAPAFAVIDDYLFLSSSCKLLEQAIECRDGTRERLKDAIGYKLMASKLRREVSGSTPSMLLFNQPDQTLRHWYNFILDEKNLAYFEEHAEGNRFFSALHEAVEADELPPFEVLQRYFAPSGLVLYDTDTGFHATSFTFRRGE